MHYLPESIVIGGVMIGVSILGPIMTYSVLAQKNMNGNLEGIVTEISPSETRNHNVMTVSFSDDHKATYPLPRDYDKINIGDTLCASVNVMYHKGEPLVTESTLVDPTFDEFKTSVEYWRARGYIDKDEIGGFYKADLMIKTYERGPCEDN